MKSKSNKIGGARTFLSIFIKIAACGCFIALIFNTWFLVVTPFSTYKNYKNKTLDTYVKNSIVNKNSTMTDLFSTLDSNYLLNLEKDYKNSKEIDIAYRRCIELVDFEIAMIVIYLIFTNLDNFISKDNIENPFSEKSIKYINNTIKCGWIGLISYCIISIFANIILLINKSGISYYSPNGKFINISLFLCLYLLKYILIKGQEKINE